MIYLLFVTYNVIVQLPQDLLRSEGDFRTIVFENSSADEIREANKEYCNSHHIGFETQSKNIGLSRAYNFVIKKYVGPDDWVLLLDSDTHIDNHYLDQIPDLIKSNKAAVYSPININQRTQTIDSPKLFKKGFFLSSVPVALHPGDVAQFNGINNGLLVKGSVFKEVGYYDERIFVYFSDAYLFFQLVEKGIPVAIVDYRNLCDFSVTNPDKKAIVHRIGMMKKDAKIFYKIVYKTWKRPGRAWLHYWAFFFKKAKESAAITKKRYFFSYLFAKRAK